MKRETHFAIGRLAILMVLAAAGTARPMDGTGGPIGPGVDPRPDAVGSEATAPASEPLYLQLEGYGNLSVLSDGWVTASFSADIYTAPEGLELLVEPEETYVLAMDARGFLLVNADGELFLARDETAVEQRGFSPAEVVMVGLGGGHEERSDAESVLNIEGDLRLAWEPETGSGYLELQDPAASARLELEFGIEQGMDLGEMGFGGFWSGCWIHCGLFDSCFVTCPLWGGKCASCTCEEDGAECKCVDCGGDGGGAFDPIDVVDVDIDDIDIESSPADAPSVGYESEGSVSGGGVSWGS